MPSEAQSQEPRDRGPPPPVTRAGRSAQLAKAAATSSAPERRPRGRPRKDGSGGSHSGPPAALPPAPPPPKPRKKGRSRGRAQVENEESMNITERNHPQKETETQEKTTGRRRSTTRRKSNTNPEPSPEPDPGPTDLDCPSVAEPHVEPVSSIEEEDRSCAALDPPPACGLGEDLQVSPMDLHHSPVPSPRHTPAHMAVDCSPRCVPMETEGANPTEQGPALSPCSSPPISPRPQLEDEDLPSPLFQRCLSEDSGGSPTPSLGHTEQRLKQCAFCYRGDELTLGQGRLVVFGPTPGYIPLHILNRRASSDRDSDCHDHCYQHSQAPPTCSSPEPCDDKSSSEFMEQLGVIGLPHDINVQSLFDFTGQCCAHLQCAAWSEGVCRGEGQSLLYVDKAIDSGSTQVCVFCHRLGASLRCQEVGCGRSYHFPCAAAAGAHQDWKKRLTLCTRHTHTVSPQCVACAGGGDVSSLLMCCCCGNHYHGNCLVPPLAPSSLCRAGWQCPQCRVCQSCRLRGDKGMLLVCERCDKSYHTHCLSPPLEHTPVSWSCKNCRVCRRCDVRSSGQWANHPFLCGSCDPALPCPLCGHAPNFNSLQDCVTCICCYRSVHAMCIGQARVGTTGTGGYICSPCRPREDELIPATQIPNRPTPALPPSPKQETVISTSLLPFARLSEAPPISPAAYSPVPPLSADFPKTPTTASQESLMPSPPVHSELHHTLPHASPCPLELQQSPVPLSPDPQELQQSASPLPPDPSELHQSPPPLSPNPPELQQSLAPSPPNSSELKQSPAPLLTYPIELIHSPPPVFPSPSELQQSPPPSPPDPLEFQQSPAVLAPYPIELNHSPPPPPLSPSELHQTKPSLYPNPSDLRQSPAPLPSCPSELQQSPAPLPSCPSELQKSPAPLSCSPIELQQNPPLLSPSPSDLHDLPLLSPIHTELQQNSEPLPLNPIELQNSPPSSPSPAELQNPPSLPLVITELQKRSDLISLRLLTLLLLPLSPSNQILPYISPLHPQPHLLAGSLEASPLTPNRDTLVSSCPCSPFTPSPLLGDCPQDIKPTSHKEAEVGEGVFCQVNLGDNSQSQGLIEPVAVGIQTTKDEHQSHPEVSQKEEEKAMRTACDQVAVQQPMREKQGEEAEEEGVRGRMDEGELRQGAEPDDHSDVEEEEPVSPVLDLDASLDVEVMELMTSSSPPPSLLHLPSLSPPPLLCRGKGRSLRALPTCSRPSDDLAIRLRQSPFSTEASPETSPTRIPITPPPLSPPSPQGESPPLCKAPPPTVLPLTPKIGMGKPAISKRKFSPGRARVRQGSWWSNLRAVSPPISSQDSAGEGGWDSPKPRPLDSPLWSTRVGRGAGFPGRRRSRGGGVGGGRGGRGRSRLKTQDSVTLSPGFGVVEPFQQKDEEENSMHNTVVMFSTSDHFTLRQDMCVVCGSFGQGAEGRLLACSQCGQCYHPYCVNVKITRVILTKGWRCLECTVCEACGEASDPGRLLLCDDCDISYHTYCLDPPLHTVPKGAWKCKWCVWCVHCGSTSPGLHCDWQSNYSRCGPCASLSCCPLCQRLYTHDDLILQCQQCDRWVHAICQGLTTEDEVEIAADEGFDCSLCRTQGRSSYVRLDSFSAPYMAQIISRIREPDTKTYTQDGVCLTESGLSHLQSLVEPLTSPRRYRRCKPKLKLRIINQNSVSVLQTHPDPDTPTEQDPGRGDLDCDIKSDSSPERDHTHENDITKEPEVTDGNKKRKRKPYRPGIGGFMVRQRGGKAGPSRIKLCRKDSVAMLPGQDEDLATEMAPAADQTVDKVKKRYRKKKTKLEEAFPSYLQEAFFGRDLLDRSQQVPGRAGLDAPGANQLGAADKKTPTPSGLLVGTVVTNKKHGMLPMSEDALVDLSDVLNTDPHILATGHTGQFQVERSPSPFAGLDISSVAEDHSLISDVTGNGGRGQRAAQEEPLDAILSPELDKMVTDGAILSRLYKIPELEGKDVEEVFTAVLSPNSSNHQSELGQHTHTVPGSKTDTQVASRFPRVPLMNGLMGSASPLSDTLTMPSGAQGPVGFRMAPTERPSPSLATTSQAPGESEQDAISTTQRGMLKWEKEETLGELATVAPVLYCNTNFPQLREQYPDWSTRVKQIAKLWRKASSQDRAPYVQKARDNRAAQRINKVQLANEPLKRHQPSQPPPQGAYDSVSIETDLAFRDPLRPKESEQEQEWKLRQGEVKDRWAAGKKSLTPVAGSGPEAPQMRQKSKQLAKMEATQKLEQVKNEQLQQQRQQQLAANQSPQPSVTGGNASPLHPPPASRQQSSGLVDDVFLRPQAPPPSGFSLLPHSPHPSSPLNQPPSSPQMFSPPSSRPSSPWDPYTKAAGTPRPASSQPSGPPTPQQQQRSNSLNASPAHDILGSPAPSPDSKTVEVSRNLGPQPGLQQTRPSMMSPSPGSAAEHPARHVAARAAESYVRTVVQGGVFKAPMPPQHQLQPEAFGSTGGGSRRDLSRPTDPGFGLPQSQDASFPSSPLSGLGSPHRSPYAQMPGTPRLDYSQQISDPFVQQSPLTSRPSPDPYSNPQTPGTPRPHSDPAYLNTSPARRPDQFNQPSVGRRPSPSHPTFDPYGSNPGTPRPLERFSRSPSSQRSNDPYAQPPGTPRPSLDPYAQQPSTPRPQVPVESFTPQPARSPLGPGLSVETVGFTPTHHQPSPGRPQQDSLPRIPCAQTSKHPGMAEETGFTQTSGHDPFEQGHTIPGPSQTDKTAGNDMVAGGVASVDCTLSIIPQLGDSEEKLRQRQRLRQLILRQQQQKSALRQEKGLQEPAAGPAPGSVTPHHWSQEDVSASTTPQTDVFGRPPPPYPGTVRPARPQRFPGVFPGGQQRSFPPNESLFPQSVRGPALRFGVTPGASAAPQDHVLRPTQASGSGSGLGAVEGIPLQSRRPMPGEFTAIRLLAATSAHPHVMSGIPQHFLPRSLPIQQHSIMGQPYIELRHRAPENRLRLPFSVATPTDPEAPLVHHRDPQPSVARPGQGTRMGETPAGQHMGMPEGIEDQQHLSHATGLGQGGDTSLPGTDGLEEHMEGEDSAVKDLEDVEVKDLVDLNLNLDPEDGKEDLDLGPNDLHLDDFLLSGKFDLIAYADPELNLEDKKDMFNEELDLGESVEDKEVIDRKDRGDGPRKVDNHAHLKSQVKQEVEDGVKREASDVSYAAPPPSAQPGEGSRRPPGPAGPPDSDTTGSSQPASLLLCKEMSGESGSGSGVSVALQAQEQAPSSGMIPNVLASTATGQQSVLQQRPFGPSTSAVLPPPSQTHPLPSIPSLTPQAPATPPHLLALQTPQPRLLLNPQTLPPHPGASAQSKSPNQIQNKPKLLLLEEQPLLLQDLLDQERQEQQQQKQMQALIRHKSTPDLAFPDMTDFDSISDPIMKAKMVALKGINKVMTQGNLGLNHMVINRIQQTPGTPETTLPPPHTLGQDGKLNPQVVRPNPPSFGSGFSNESQRRQYEEWLGETQQLLQMQQGLLEDQIAAHRKTKKALSAKQRTAKRAGRALTEDDAAQLRYITEQQGTVQKQLEQIRKQQKDHTELIEDYRSKQQRVLPQPTASPSMSLPQTLLSQPQVPRQPHPVGPASACVPTVPASWLPGGGTPGVMGQRMPPALPTPSHTQVPPQAMVAGHAASSAGFTTGVRGPAGRPTGATGDGGAPPPQVKFDDNNPFSEGFQERERRERLKEQQERQRVQLMQEVERHRVLQQRLEREQQDLLGAPVGTGALLGPTKGPGGPTGPAPGPRGDGLAQMPFFSSELPQDFLQSSPASRTLQPSQVDAPFPQQGFSEAAAEQGRVLPEHGPLMEISPRPACPTRPPAQGQVHPLGIEVAGMTPSQAHRFGHESLSSSPSAPRPPSFPSSSSAGPTALVQLYPDIIPDDKPKKKKNGRRDGDDTVGGARTPLSSHSDDLTAPPTPAVSDTSCSTPTRAGVELSDFALPHGSSLCGLAPLSDLERQQAISSAAQEKALTLGTEAHRGLLSGAQLEVKQEEHDELGSCGGGIVKMEECGGEVLSSPLHGGSRDGDGGKELLRHLLKEKTLPSKTPSPTSQIQPPARQQLSVESIRSEGEDGPGSHGYAMMMGSLGRNLLNSSGKRKPQRCKRAPRPDKDKGPPKYKRRKREEEEEKTRHSSSSPDQLMTHLRQLSVLPLMEPVLGVDLSLFPPYGSSCLGRDSRLTGSFGNACLDGVTDYYSHLIYKQNNLSNPPTPPASLPPTPPPIARQKLLNGFATVEELSRKDLREQDVKGVSAVKPKGEELLPLGHASKTVDVPASLPTPPHNNQEELRVQDTPGHVSPDGFIPSSSPESVTDMEVSRYPDFSFIKLEPASACPSPPIPIMPCAWGKGSVMKQEVKVEPNHQGRPSCSNTDLVTMTITLNPLAAQNVPGVMATVAELLQVPVPMDYQLSRASGPSRSSLVMLAGVQVPLPQVAAGGRPRPPAAGNSGIRMDNIQYGCSSAAAPVRPQFCSSCKVLLGNGVRIIKELKQEGLSPRGTSLVFCSPNCSALYTSSLQSRTSTNKSACERSPPSRMQHQYTNNMSSISVHSLPRNVLSPPAAASSSPLHFPSASTVTMEIRPRVESLKVKVKLKPHPRAISGGEDSLSSRHGKRMKNSRWRRWGVNVTLTRGPCIPDGAVAMPTEEEVDVLLKKLGVCLHPDPLPRDQRRCCFCHQQGDGQTDGPARLLNLDLDLWVHLNCALWSSEVYETQAGALINVELALRRGLTLRCAHCQQTGATSGCNRLRCTNTYHFTCALQAHCTFFKDKTMLCHLHKPRMATLGGDRSSSSSPSSTPGLTPDLSMACDPYDSELRCFAVFRRVYVQRDEARQIAAVVQRGEQQHTFRVGSLLFHTVGRLLPHQMNSFHEKTAIYPMGYHANRIYWSMRHSNRRCKYMCYIEEANARPLFKVKVVEKGYEDLVLTASSPKGVWDQILEPVAQLRSSSGTLKLFPVYLKGEDLFGLTTSAVSRIIESLPGVEACERYTFRYGRNPLMEWPLAFNPSGSARSEPKACHAKRPYLLSSIASRCQGSVGSIVGLVPGVISLSPGESVAGAHQGRHSKSSQYRRMKAEWKSNVYLARSRIQGLGLYAARDIEKCTMVIEYIGTIIRSEVANRKERLYESQNRGVYMFRIDNDYVIDATITGGPARYINHSCAPNCITEVVTVEKENKIVISSCRRIQRGEELSYDYKFDLEDDQHKIPCHCGAFNCRKWMN
ncbi:histone-lysine N-methyltransferase 2C-like [Aulostomus maculatus]